MAEPHDAPSAAELVEAVREWIDNDVLPATDGRLKFHARVASNMLGMVEREFELGSSQQAHHHARLERLGVDDDAALAGAIRRREFDDRGDELRAALRESVVAKLSVANPAYLD